MMARRFLSAQDIGAVLNINYRLNASQIRKKTPQIHDARDFAPISGR
jgi:hypothetical protein